MWWKGGLIDGGVGRVPKNWVHQEFHIPTFSNVMEQTSPLTKYNDARAHAGSACRGLKAKGMEYWGQATPGGPLKVMGYQVRHRVVISRMSGGGTGLILGDIGVARTGYRELPAVCGIHQPGHQEGAGSSSQGSFQPFKVWGLPYLPHVDISHKLWWILNKPLRRIL